MIDMSGTELAGSCEWAEPALGVAGRGEAASSRSRGASVAEIEALYRARATVFVHFATGMLGDGELARDVVQDAFAKAISRREGFRGEGSLETWMWSMVLNTARNAARSRSLRLRVKPPPEAWREQESPHDCLDGEARVLRELIAHLPERQRMCVFLYYFADLDYAAIAVALGIRRGTVAATLNAARATLRQGLEGEQ
jgi:RNA polymerase sigma-70 factor, ECF subfamily